MATEHPSPPSFTPRRKWAVGGDLLVRTVIVLAVVVMANYLSGKLFQRAYLSDQTRTELSPRTVNLVRSLTNDVKVTLYYDRDEELFTTVHATIREYRALNPRIQLDIVDYLRDAADAQRVKLAYKLPEATQDEEKNFVIFECEGRWKVVNARMLADYQLDIDKAKGTYRQRPIALKAEALFNGCLLAVIAPRQLKAYVLVGYGEHKLDSGDEVTGYLSFRSLLEQNYIRVEPLNLLGTNTVPDDCNLLIIPGPTQPISESALERIDQYLNEGGRMFALFNAAATERKASLEKVLVRWGVLVSEAVVQDPENSLNTLRSSPGADVTIGAFAEHPAVKALLGLNLNLIMPRPVIPMNLPGGNAETTRVTPLFATQPTATVAGNPKVPARSFPLAVAVERAAVTGVVTGRGTTRMIVVGDSLFLGNGTIKLLANRDFADQAVNWLLERPHLTDGVGPRPIQEYRIAMTAAQMRTVQWLLLGALPGGILLFGGLVWLRRRK